MTHFMKLAAVALAAVVVSTSLASAGGLTIKPGVIKIVHLTSAARVTANVKPTVICAAIDKTCIQAEAPTTPPYIPVLWVPEKPTIKFPLIPIHFYPTAAGGQQPNPQLAVDCEVHSTAATTNDMFVINTGNTQLPSGTQIDFRVASSGDRGGFLLPASLDVGAKLKIPGLLHAAESGAPCAVKIVS